MTQEDKTNPKTDTKSKMERDGDDGPWSQLRLEPRPSTLGMPETNLLCLANKAFWLSRGLISAPHRKENPNLAIIGETGKDAM